MKKLFKLLAVLMCMLLQIGIVSVSAEAVITISGTVSEVQKYGNLTLDILPEELTGAGFAVGDIVTVTAGDVKLDMPVGTSYSDVDTGDLVVRLTDTQVIVAINMGNFSTTYGVVEGDNVKFELKEAGGYLAEYAVRQLTRTNSREDYASDKIFANFREITTTGICEGVLYRSASPVNNEINRAAFADALAEDAGIATVINLADSKESIASYRGAADFNSPYYAGLFDEGKVITLNMGVDIKSDDFGAKLADGLRFMIDGEAPYLVHCTEGKDRAGFTSAVLEMLMGATINEVVEDYMTTYENYYGVEKGSDQYNVIAKSNIYASVATVICHTAKDADLTEVDLQEATKSYLAGLGMTEDEISALQAKLSGACDDEPEDIAPTPEESVTEENVIGANENDSADAALPQTGTLPTAIFFMVGAAMILCGKRLVKKEEN